MHSRDSLHVCTVSHFISGTYWTYGKRFKYWETRSFAKQMGEHGSTDWETDTIFI